MKKIARLKGICSKETRLAYLDASPEERETLRSQILEESKTMIEQMSEKGYRLEATVADVLGLFTRGAAAGAVKLVPADEET